MRRFSPMTKMIALMLLFTAALAHAAPLASVDRSQIGPDETITLRISDSESASAPDLSPLEQDFDILRQSSSRQISIVNGSTRRSTEWQITLAPKRSGQLQIPPIDVGNGRTQALLLTVSEQPAASDSHNALAYIETDLSQHESLVQAQTLLTLRIYLATASDNLELEELKIDHAVVQKLEPRQYQKRQQDRVYNVIEVPFAIFPQRPGTLQIPALKLSGALLTAPQDFWGQTRAQRLRLQSDPQILKVQPAPAGISGAWLPAREVELEQQLSTESGQTLHVGDTITRRLSLRAEAALLANLPDLATPTIAHARQYPEPAKDEQVEGQDGIVAKRVLTTAIVASEPGELELPPLEISWWDTKQQQLRRASVPGARYQVLPAEGSQATHQVGSPSPLAQPATASTAGASSPSDSRWQWLTGLFASLWLLTLGAWFMAHRRQPATEAAPVPARPAPAAQLQQAITAAKRNDAAATRQALLHWASQQWPAQPATLQLIADQLQQTELAAELSALDQHLYGATPQGWRGEALAKALGSLPARHSREKKEALGALYPGG